jgi:large subunit ribosomal protein L18
VLIRRFSRVNGKLKDIKMAKTNLKIVSREKRKLRIRKKLSGTPECPRLSVFRSANHIYAQIIDDVAGSTVVSASSTEKDFKEKSALGKKSGVATYIGKLIAERAKTKGINKVVFDRNGFLYHGRIKAVSDGAREGGLVF